MDGNRLIPARIRSVSWESSAVLRYALEPAEAMAFPAAAAGAHINVAIDAGIVRSYSLLNDAANGGRYEIAVQLEPDSRGGSRRIHERWKPGQIIEIAAPANNFALDEGEHESVLIAGGIGITPMLSMIDRLQKLGRTWQLHYACRTRDRAAFLDRLESQAGVSVYLGDRASDRRPNLAAIVAAAPVDAHFYCCGPQTMLEAFRAATSHLGSRAHFEFFSASTEVAKDGGYTLELVRSARRIEVPAGTTMLDALLDAGVNVGFACSEGICGTCKVGVTNGIPDHRDHFLTPEEKCSNQAVMVCCSGAKTATLSLDL